ncbi:dihydroneopterin aldolase [Stenotrophobium rhamnosiphilum]|uniref:7,8-dihydroneopterin aldolase n=1 Tax=Stenotrophobium rhamnosiphilum TaxID=2029166 RepID=A0A2T5MBH6_9GAMM|nr:dihydroneopterin aldolase [Stenotrophobium rhamnosiphilum]PTU29078.1 dihydroneopterin aldolase [Stenotrophobium rhamnosiphilum]
MDKVFIRGLQAHTVIGIYDWEQRAERPLIIDIVVGVDTRAAAASDNIRDAVNYHAISDAVMAFVKGENVHLLETMAERLARFLFAEFPIDTLELRIAKPGAVPGVDAVGVEIERQRGDYAVCGAR